MATMEPLHVHWLREALKNPNVKESDLQILREWCQKQAHLPKIEDLYLILLLHSNYYRLEPTKTTIDNFFTTRTHVPELFANRDPFLKELRDQLSAVATIPLKARSKDGNQVILNRIMDPNPSNYNFFECSKGFLLLSELCTLTEGLTNGHEFVIDVANLSLGHVGRMNLMGLKKFVFYIQEAAPVRLKYIHIINHNTAVETLINICKPFMKKELFDLIRFHNSLKSLEEFVPIDSLPNECGGKAGNAKDIQQEQIKILEDNREWLLQMDASMVVDESLRAGKPKSSSDLFGVDGSFKKLDID